MRIRMITHYACICGYRSVFSRGAELDERPDLLHCRRCKLPMQAMIVERLMPRQRRLPLEG